MKKVRPSITSEPSSATVNVGQPATFSVSNTGTAPFTYQWKRNGRSISGANSSSYTTPATATSDSGSQYDVVVRNGEGSATSSMAVLTVVALPPPPPPPPTEILNSSATSLDFGSVNVSTSSMQSITLTNAGTGSVTISNISVSGAGFNASGISSGTVLAAGQSATLDAVFAPATSGGVSGSVTVGSNATAGAITIALSGTGAAVAHSALLSWTPSDSSAIGYNVYVSTVSGSSYTKLTSAPINTLTYTDAGLVAAQTRYYVVTTVDSDNLESAYSNEAAAIIP